MKIIIADDENLVRASLISMIQEMETTWEIVGEATHGQELLKQLAEHKPNIAIVDIRMPNMDGLEAIRIGKTISPLTNWIVLSGYSDFAYAQAALKLGVSEYLLKPIDPEHLEKALENIIKDNLETIDLLNQQFENNLAALTNGLTSIKQGEHNSLMHKGEFIGWRFVFDSTQSDIQGSGQQSKFYDEVRLSFKRYLGYGMNLALIGMPDGELAAVGAWCPAKGDEGKRRVDDFFCWGDSMFNEIQE